MTQEEIIKYDKLIDDFMGTKHPRRKYHSSWDWLMPVVEKMQNWYNTESDGYNEEDVDKLRIFDLKIYEPIRSVYYHVIQFIQWYNTQNKNLQTN